MTDCASVEARCPANEHKLLARILVQPGARILRHDGNLVEIACRDCSTKRRRAGHADYLVRHRFNIVGELVESVYDNPVDRRC